jgi:hypothetical protein
VLDIGHQEGDEPFGEPRRGCVPLRSQLAGDEADGQNAELLRRVQQPLAGALPGSIVLEGNLVETGKCVSDMRLIVDRQSPLALGIDVGKCAVRQAGALLGAERGHASKIPRSLSGENTERRRHRRSSLRRADEPLEFRARHLDAIR